MIGRDAELAAMSAILSDPSVASRLLILAGNAGVGKTALLRTGEQMARDSGFVVLRCTGLLNDMPLGFADLYELLLPVLDRTADLPARQRDALWTAFGESHESVPDRFHLKLAVLGLLEELAEDRPVALFVDDWQWLDPSTADVLQYVARELPEASIALVVTVRTDADDAHPVLPVPGAVVSVAPLSGGDVHRLLDALPFTLTKPARARVLDQAEGNPLALIEMAGAYRNGVPAAETANAAEQPPVTTRLERSFLQELETHTAGTRRLLLAAAAGVDITCAELIKAGHSLAYDNTDVTALRRSGLLSAAGHRPVFRHPLVRSAVYRNAALADRLAVHRALAETVTDLDRAAWHRAAATVGADDTVAAELLTVARHAAARGALAEAVAALRRAAELSTAAVDKARHLADAAEAARQAGLGADAAALIEQSRRLTADTATVVRLAQTEAGNSVACGIGSRSVEALLALVRRLAEPGAPADAEQQLRLLWAIAGLSVMYPQPPEAVAAAVEELERLPLSAADPVRALSLALLDPLTRAKTVRPRLPEFLPLIETDSKILLTYGWAATALQDVASAIVGHQAAVEHLHRAGRSGDEARELAFVASLRVIAGDLGHARSDAEAAVRMAAALGLPMAEAEAHAALALCHAWDGDAAAVSASVRRSRVSAVSPWRSTLARASWASGIAALGDRRYRDAWVALAGTAEHQPTALWAVADIAEAAARSGKVQHARDAVAEAERYAKGFASDHLTAVTSRARALLEPADTAGSHFERSLRYAHRADAPLELARTQLAYGRWMRRRRLVARAKDHLAHAFDIFSRAGARAWAEQTAEELRAAGGVPPGLPSAAATRVAELLTPQELQVAELVAAGLTNKEIADRLYLSHRTVGTHLYHVTDKLGLTQRSQLRDALEQAANEPGRPQ